MFFEDEPEHIKQARKAPLHSTWESRNPPEPLPSQPLNDASKACYEVD